MAEEYFETRPSRIHVTTAVNNFYDIDLDDEICSPSDYREELHVLRMATENDVIHLHLCTPGGTLSTCLQVVEAVKNCVAPVFGFVGAECSSAGSFISMFCDDLVISDYASSLVHTSMGGTIGSPNDTIRQAVLHAELMEKLIRDAYTGFLSETELTEVLDNKQMYLSAEEIKERWNNRQEYRKQQAEMESKAQRQSFVDEMREMLEKEVVAEEKPVRRTRKPKTE